MACNCKKKIEEIDKKYGDGNGNIVKNLNPLLKVLRFFAQLLFGIVCGAFMIVLVAPLLLYIIFCIMFGIEPMVRIIDIRKFLKKKK